MKSYTRKAFALTILFIPLFATMAQELKIGQRCPDVLLKNIINFSSSSLKFSDFKGKFIILDFWGTGCSSCINAFPKIDSLQRKFEGKIQFFAVNQQSRDSTIRFFAKRKRIRVPSIPFVTEDTLLSGWFPHIYVPHHVWIDSSGIVKFITDGFNATEQHISSFLNGAPLILAVKKYEKDDYFDSPMMAVANGKWNDQIESYSLLMHSLSGVTFSNSAVSTAGKADPNKFTEGNASILQLYVAAFSEGGRYDFSASNTVILDVKDSFKYEHPKNFNYWDDWTSKNSYNYEFMVSPSQSDQLYKKMQQDLVRYFGLNGHIEKRKVKCLVLKRTLSDDKLKTKGGEATSNFWIMTEDSLRYIKNQSFQILARKIAAGASAKGLSTPFVDATNYLGNIDIQISTGVIDELEVGELKKEIAKYGLDLVEENKLQNVLILKE